MTTTVTYHRDSYGPGRPAVNVKLHVPGLAFRAAAVDAVMHDADRIHELAYERVLSDFWQSAEELATQYGLGAIAQEGRSGGWLVFTDAPDIEEQDALTPSMREWIRAYARYTRWARAEVSAAPGRVAQLAQDIAMDELGARAVFPTVSTKG